MEEQKPEQQNRKPQDLIRRWKRKIKDGLTAWRRKQYFRRMEEMTVTYDEWIREKEAALSERLSLNPESRLSIRRIPYEVCGDYLTGGGLCGEKAELVLFTAKGGEEASLAEALLSEFFMEHGEVDMAYGDEDVMSPEGVRYTPWLKPDWSPDTFLSGFYFGNVFAVRTRALRALSGEERMEARSRTPEDCRNGVYRLCMILAEKCGGFRKRQGPEGEFPVGHIDEILYHSHRNRETDALYPENVRFSGGRGSVSPESEKKKRGTEQELLSVIIPSKDHPELLRRCIESVKRMASVPIEIIVVDNGSGEETRRELTGWLKEQKAVYLYEPMPFHFSRMCNLGAAAAGGQVYLFLNDDVEAGEGAKNVKGRLDCFYELYTQALMPWAGALGVRLCYPDSRRIQHAGIVNVRPGPVHKLQFVEDSGPCCHGFNRGKRNVIAVTGACLAVAAEKFKEAGGFPEELPVAFNDVDLCFTLYEQGWYNAVLQDFYLYHHESLSRGQDEDKEKLERLVQERTGLYERHRRLYGRDPFYHKYFARDIISAGFDTGAGCEWREDGAALRAKKLKRLSGREDGCVMVGLEYAGTLAGWTGRPDRGDYYIQGYCFITGSDNACYDKKLLLLDGEKSYTVTPKPRIRGDVERNLPDQVNVGLSGFEAVIDGHSLEKGDYRIGVLVLDRCSGQRLYHMTNRYLHCV